MLGLFDAPEVIQLPGICVVLVPLGTPLGACLSDGNYGNVFIMHYKLIYRFYWLVQLYLR